MNIKVMPTVWSVIDLVELFTAKAFRKQARGGALEAVKAEAAVEYDEVAGSFVAVETLRTRTLVNVKPNDAGALEALGAVCEKLDDGTEIWTVPNSIPEGELDRFWNWLPVIPADLRENEPKMVRTKHGRAIESRVLPEDWAKGNDSLASPLLYGAFAALGAVSHFLFAVHTLLGLASMLLVIPFVVALKQSENAKEAIWTLAACYLAPLALAQSLGMMSGVAAAGSQIMGLIPLIGPLLAGASQGALLGKVAMAVGLIIPLTIVGVIARMLFSDPQDQHGTVIGGMFEQFKHSLQWAIIGAVLTSIALALPDGFGGAAFFIMAAFAPLNYTEKNNIARGMELQVQGDAFGLGTDPSNIMSSFEKIRTQQVLAANADDTPLILLGFSQGQLAIQRYPFAVDAGVPMKLSLRDLTMHFLGFGATGKGKTVNMARSILLQYRATGFGGAFVRDGKQTLAAEMRAIIDIMIEPGVQLAFFEGLDAKGVSLALNSFSNAAKAKDPIWENGASAVIDHATTIHEALCKHEPKMREVAIAKTRALESQLDYLNAEIVRMEKEGRDTTEAQKAFGATKENKDRWARLRDGERKYLWNGHTLLAVLNAMNKVEVVNGMPAMGAEMRAMADFLGYKAQPARVQSGSETIHEDLGGNTLLDQTLDYVFHAWIALDPGQRSSFMMNAMDRIMPLFRGKDLKTADGTPWYMLETGVDVSQALYGKFVGMNIPENEHGRAADMIQALMRQRIYSGIKKRAKHGNKWQEKMPGQMPMMDMCDECQLVVGKEEADLAPVARSLGMMMVFFTQGFESLGARFDDVNETAKFANTFQSIVALDCSPETKGYLIERFGKVAKIVTPMGGQGLNYERGLHDWHTSTLNDPRHPNRAVMRKIERAGGGKMVAVSNARAGMKGGPVWEGHQTTRRADATTGRPIQIAGGLQMKLAPLFDNSHYELLKGRGVGVAYLQRAGVPRADVIQMNYVSDKTLDLVSQEPDAVCGLIRLAEEHNLPIEKAMNLLK